MRRRRVIVLCGLLTLVAPACRDPESGSRVIGAVLPLTGSASEIGDSVRKGVELGLDEKNHELENAGRRYVVRYTDSQASIEVGRAAVQSLIDQGVSSIIGPAASSVVLESASLANQSQTILISPTASNPSINAAGEYVFRTTASDLAEVQAMASYCLRKGLQRIALATIINAYGDGFREAFTERFMGIDGSIVADERFAQGATEFAIPLRRIQDLQPDAIYLVGYPAEMTRFLLAMAEMEIRLPVLATGSFRFEPLLERVGAAAEGVVFTQPAYDPGDATPLVQGFVQRYHQRYGKAPDIYAAYAYDTVRLLISVIEIAGYEGASIRSSLHAVEEFPGVTGPITFDAHGDVMKIPQLGTVRDGRFVPLR